jgi:hypothetical protein
MRQKGRRDIQQGLLIGSIALAVASTAHAQVTQIDFQVIHLPRHQSFPDVPYVAIRTQEAWDKLWPENYPNLPPIPKIDFKKFNLMPYLRRPPHFSAVLRVRQREVFNERILSHG